MEVEATESVGARLSLRAMGARFSLRGSGTFLTSTEAAGGTLTSLILAGCSLGGRDCRLLSEPTKPLSVPACCGTFLSGRLASPLLGRATGRGSLLLRVLFEVRSLAGSGESSNLAFGIVAAPLDPASTPPFESELASR